MQKKGQPWDVLIPGDQIDVIAPASASTEMKLSEGVRWLEQRGYQAHLPEDLISVDLFFAAPLETQLSHLQAALDSEAKAIWCLRGGYGSMRLVPHLDRLIQPKKTKLLIGFSDITSLHLFFAQKWGWPTLHGRTISQLKADFTGEEAQLYENILSGNVTEVVFDQLVPMNHAATSIQELHATLTGGNLRIVQSSLLTQWQVDATDKFLFLEDVSERGYSVDRMLEQLLQAGIIHSDVKAILFGDFNDGLEKNGQDLVPAALERFASRVEIPVFRGLPCGHSKKNYPLFFNTPAKLLGGLNPQLICQTNL